MAYALKRLAAITVSATTEGTANTVLDAGTTVPSNGGAKYAKLQIVVANKNTTTARACSLFIASGASIWYLLPATSVPAKESLILEGQLSLNAAATNQDVLKAYADAASDLQITVFGLENS